MDLTVIIPTRERAAKLARCIEHLCRQDLEPERFEVLVGVDGEDDRETGPAGYHAASAVGGRVRVEVHVFKRRGLAAARNDLISRARGRFLLSMNDDVYAEAGFCRAHVEAGLAGLEGGKPVTVVGDSPWVVHEPDRLFDRVVRETSMVFFYDQMGGHGTGEGKRGLKPAALRESDPDRDWGFRHAFGLNVSYPTALVREVGGYAVFPRTYGFEDIEIAWRLKERYRMPVVFRPAARGWHDHRMEPGAYLERERKLGAAAWGFAAAAPACARETFGRDITSREEVEYSRAFVEREARGVERLRAGFLRLAELPASAADGAWGGEIVRMAYEQHLLIKRWEWRKGLLEEAGRA